MKKILHIIGIISITYSVMAGFGYAEGDSSTLSKTAEGLYYLISFLSWGRVVLASIAGKLMTNDMVFGGFMNMDSYLFKIHMIVRTVANYGLGFGFITLVGRQLFATDIAIGTIAKKIGGFILAGLLINVSFFAVQVLVDISTIATVAAGSMSQSFLGHNISGSKDAIKASAKNRTRVTYKADGTTDYTTTTKPEDVNVKDILDSITPNDKSVAGPLIYLGSSILGMQRYSLLKQTVNDTQRFNDTVAGKNLALGFLIQLVVVGVFSLALTILVIANVIRIGMIWIMAALGPLLFLIRGLQRGGVSLPKWVSSLASKNFSIGSFVKLIFLPVFSVFMLGVTIIFISSINGMLSKNIHHEGVDLTDNKLQINNVIETTYNGNFLSDSKDVFADIVITAFTLFLLWYVALASVPSKTPIIGGIANSIKDIAKQGLLSTEFINIPGMGKRSIGGLAESLTKSDGSLNPLRYGRDLNRSRERQGNTISQKFANLITGNKSVQLTETDIENAIRAFKREGLGHKQQINNLFHSLKTGISKLQGSDVIFPMRTIANHLPDIAFKIANSEPHSSLDRGKGKDSSEKILTNEKNIRIFIELFAKNIGMKPPSNPPRSLDGLKALVLKK